MSYFEKESLVVCTVTSFGLDQKTTAQKLQMETTNGSTSLLMLMMTRWVCTILCI
jgi:hypothetical protein